MGVKTKVFGKFAWIVFEGIGAFYDECMAELEDDRLKCLLRDCMREFLFLIGIVLPCVYCRISYREFTDPTVPGDGLTDINKSLALPDPFAMRKLVYNLHNCVNRKLHGQERETALNLPNPDDSKLELEKVEAKWAKNNITFERALEIRFPSVSSQRFCNSLVVFLALMMCDWRDEESCYIFRFMKVIGKILSFAVKRRDQVMAEAYMQGFDNSLPLWQREMTFPNRIDIVWGIKKRIYDMPYATDWEFNHTRQSFESKCRESIAGCSKS